jgi:hypothetical protein
MCGNNGAAEIEDAGQVDGDVALPILVGLLPDVASGAGDSGVVDQHIDAAGLFENKIDAAANRIGLGHVGFDGE